MENICGLVCPAEGFRTIVGCSLVRVGARSGATDENFETFEQFDTVLARTTKSRTGAEQKALCVVITDALDNYLIPIVASITLYRIIAHIMSLVSRKFRSMCQSKKKKNVCNPISKLLLAMTDMSS